MVPGLYQKSEELCYIEVANQPGCRFFVGIGPLVFYLYSNERDGDYTPYNWSGACVDGLADGVGELSRPSAYGNFFYQGTFKQGKLDGIWNQKRPDYYERVVSITGATYSDGSGVIGSTFEEEKEAYGEMHCTKFRYTYRPDDRHEGKGVGETVSVSGC